MKDGKGRFDSEYDKARELMASGNTLDGKIWLAVMGHTRQIHEEAIAQAAHDPSRVRIYDTKIRAARKLRRMRALDDRKYGISEIALTDPDVMPRYMKPEDFVNLYSAVAYANTKGAAFNVHLTINWRDLGHATDAEAESRLYRDFIRQYSEWCRDKDIDCIWIYSNESSSTVGLHTHFLTSIPDDWLEQFKRFVGKRMLKINRHATLMPRAFKVSAPRGQNIQRQWIRVQYLCKGVDPNARLQHANGYDKVFVADLIRFGYESPGDVSCKRRCGLSHNINTKARGRDGYKSLMERGMLNVNILYGNEGISQPLSDHEPWLKLQALNL